MKEFSIHGGVEQGHRTVVLCAVGNPVESPPRAAEERLRVIEIGVQLLEQPRVDV